MKEPPEQKNDRLQQPSFYAQEVSYSKRGNDLVKISDLEFDKTTAKEVTLSDKEISAPNYRDFLMELEKDLDRYETIGKAYALIAIEARDVDAARAKATSKLRELLDVLNFYSDIVSANGSYIYFPGEAELKTALVPSMTDEPVPAVSVWYRSFGPIANYPIASLGNIEKYGVSRACNLLFNKRNPLQERLLASIRWAGRATVLTLRNNKEEAFLFYAIALESIILAEGNKEDLTYRLRVRLAHLMGKTGKLRPKLAKSINDLYELRSKIVHAGKFEITDSALYRIRNLVKNTLVHLLVDEPFASMTTIAELVTWFDYQIFNINAETNELAPELGGESQSASE